MSKKIQHLVTMLAVYAVLLYTAASCIVGIGAFGISLNSMAVEKLGLLRYAAAGMAVWMMYIFGTRKKQVFQWVYVAVTIIFLGACLSSIQPTAFGAVSDSIVNQMPGPTNGFKILVVWAIAATLLIIPNTHNIKLNNIKRMFVGMKSETKNGFSFQASAETALSKEPPVKGYKPIPFVRFGKLAGDKAFTKSKYSFPVGQKDDGRPLYAELCDDTPHFLIAGATGSGKTVFLQTLTAALAYKNTPNDMQLILIDGVRQGLRPLAALPHVIHGDVIYKDADMVEAISWIYKKLDERINSDGICTPKIVTVIDEVDRYYSVPSVKKAIAPMIDTIIKDGRQFGIHLVMGSQRPSGDLITAHTLSQFERICFKVKLDRYSENIIESPDGAKLTGKGDLLYLSDGKLIHARGYYMDEKGKHEVSDFARGVAGMYPPALRVLGTAVAGRDAAADEEEDGEYAGLDDGVDLFVPDKNRAGVCMYGDNILPFDEAKSGVWGRMDSHTASYSLPYNPIQDKNTDTIQPHTDHTIARPKVTDDEIIEMVNGGGSYRDIAKFLKVSLWRVQETVRKYRESGGVIAE